MITLTVKTPDDVLLITPHVFGFAPSNGDLIVMNFGPTGAPHARIDLPCTVQEVAETVDALRPILAHLTPQHSTFVVTYGAAPEITAAIAHDTRAMFPNVLEVIEADSDTQQWRKHGSLVWRAWPVDASGITAPLVADGSAPRESRSIGALAPADPATTTRLNELRRHHTHTMAGQVHTLADAIESGDHEMVAALITKPDMLDVVVAMLRDRSVARERDAFFTRTLEKYGTYNPLLIDAFALASLANGSGAATWLAVDLCTELGIEESTLLQLLTAIATNAINPREFFDSFPTLQELMG